MSYEFDGSTEYLTYASAVISGPPFTISCWYNSDITTSGQELVSIADSSVADHHHSLLLYTQLGDINVRALTFSGGSVAAADASVDSSANVWQHACGVWEATNDRRAYFNGGNEGTDTSGRAPTGLDILGIGRREDSTPTLYMDGHIADVAIWSSALTTDEIALLASGEKPTLVSADTLIFYAPLFDDTTDDIAGLTATVGGTPVQSSTDHPNIGDVPNKKYMAGGVVFGE